MTMRRTTCPQCRKRLSDGERIHPECRDAYAEACGAKAERKAAKAIKTAAKEDRAETKRRKEAAKPRQKWLDECQAIVNKIVRLRDRNLGCCSCDRGPSWGGQWHASHLRSVGAASAVRFNLWNIARSCSICNNHLSGNVCNYLPRARERWGDDRIDWLYAQNSVVKHSVEYLKRFKIVMGKKLRRMEKRYGLQS